MNIEETRKQIAVMQAWCEGKPIQAIRKNLECSRWHEFIADVDNTWNWSLYDYRIKPSPLEIDVWQAKDGSLCHPQYHHEGYNWSERGYTKKKFREVIE